MGACKSLDRSCFTSRCLTCTKPTALVICMLRNVRTCCDLLALMPVSRKQCWFPQRTLFPTPRTLWKRAYPLLLQPAAFWNGMSPKQVQSI
jgi:hypothetical protein